MRSGQLLQAALLATGVFLAEVVRRRRAGRVGVLGAAGRATAALCEHLGATFIKVGQIASSRSDLLPAPLVEELSTLQDRVPPFAFSDARVLLEAELGQPLERLFERFDPEPVASASVAQVHRAKLHGENARIVAVKVRRPDIVDKVELDRSILLFIARNLERLIPSLRIISLEEAIRTFCNAVEEQLDLSIEAENNLLFRANFANDPGVMFPEIHPELCSTAVLTMDFVEGVHERDLDASGIDVPRVVEAGMRAVCRMIFLHGFVHADLHPGNLLFVHPGRIAFLDLGLVGRLVEEDRVTTAQLIFSLATGDGVTVARLFFENSPHTATPDYGAFERDICELVDNVRSQGLANLQVTLEIGRIFDILRRHRVQARAHMTMVNLALMTAEGMGRRLAPELSLTDAALPYLAEALGHGLIGTSSRPRAPRTCGSP